ncbi:MAG: hypothetical protein WC343_00230 [Bacilli bacterium]|jgi:hypothetical protein
MYPRTQYFPDDLAAALEKQYPIEATILERKQKIKQIRVPSSPI